MSVIIKNTTGSEIFIQGTGDNIKAMDQKIIDPKQYSAYSGSASLGTDAEDTTFIADVNSGNLVINNGNLDLTAVDGLKFLKELSLLKVQHSNLTIGEVIDTINFEGLGVTVVKNSQGKVTVTIGDEDTEENLLYHVAFTGNGSSGDKFLSLAGIDEESNNARFISPYGMQLRAITYTNKNNNTSGEIEVRKNGASVASNVFVWNFTNIRYGYKNDISNVSFAIGDTITVFLDDTGGNEPDTPWVQLTFRILDDTPSEVN